VLTRPVSTGTAKGRRHPVPDRNLAAFNRHEAVTLYKEEQTMQITDPIADMLTRIRNAGNAKHDTVDIPASKMKKAIAEILLEEGYIRNFQIVDDGTQGVIRIALKYLPGKEKAIQGLKRVSKPGLRVYAGAEELPRVLKGLGIAVVSTSKGVMTDKKARAEHVGGEVLAFIW
jgi:small subunit ribosomal protein S8